MSTSSIQREIRQFHVVVVTAKKCTKKHDHVQSCVANLNLLLFCRSPYRRRRRRRCLKFVREIRREPFIRAVHVMISIVHFPVKTRPMWDTSYFSSCKWPYCSNLFLGARKEKETKRRSQEEAWSGKGRDLWRVLVVTKPGWRTSCHSEQDGPASRNRLPMMSRFCCRFRESNRESPSLPIY